jgi:hypothetical protein
MIFFACKAANVDKNCHVSRVLAILFGVIFQVRLASFTVVTKCEM